MFEKEAEEYTNKHIIPIRQVSETDLYYAFKDGAEFGYNKVNETLQVAREVSNENLREKNRALRKRICEAKDIIFDLAVALRSIASKPLSSLEDIARAEKFLEEEI